MFTLVCPLCAKRFRVRSKDVIGKAWCRYCSGIGSQATLVELVPLQATTVAKTQRARKPERLPDSETR